MAKNGDLRLATHMLWNALKRITAGASASDNATLFYDNAEKIYCLRFAVSSGGAA